MSTCNDCEFYKAVNGTGRCKEDTPHTSTTQPGNTAVWPVVNAADEACGKFQAKS